MKRLPVICFFVASLSCLLSFQIKFSRAFKAPADTLVISGVKQLARVTGKSLPDEHLPNPNQTHERYDLGCTDLGIMWDMGNGKTGIFFGDSNGSAFAPTPGGGGNGGNWRSNVLAFSTDNNLADGLTFSGMAMNVAGTSARQIIYSPHNTTGNGSFTAIPTAAIKVNGVNYVHYMDVRQWGKPGSWTTNYSALYRSADDGATWQKVSTIRFAAESKFAQMAYAQSGGYVYMVGTPAGRFGDAYLARVKSTAIENQKEYQYYNGKSWAKGDESRAAKIFAGPVGEVSLIYNSRLKRWLVTYLDEARGQIVIRNAEQITGPWSQPQVLVSGRDFPALYGAFIHPQSKDSDDLYFLMSQWHPYNVFLFRAKLAFKQHSAGIN